MRQESDSTSNIPLCPVCGEPIGIRVLLGKNRTEHTMPRMCKCEREQCMQIEKRQEAQEKQIRLEKMFRNGLMTKEFKEMNFETWNHELGNEKMYELGIKCVKNFKEMVERNIGLLIYGKPGNGKTYFAGCIANALLKKYVPVVCVSSILILERIKYSFNKFGDEGVQNILNCLDNAELLIIDDIGTENNTNWSRSTMYQIIDSRYRKKKPLIVTSNLNIKQLKKRYDTDSEDAIGRTYDRLLNEMCTPIENNWQSIRVIKGREKTKTLGKILGIV
ncbi:DNA replication protein [Clostridium carboxidivorans P7]|uniref:AAA ATPase n=2 Tax=Clostridium TaxID=1485 RepID=C6PZR2_9CLOT|nr:DNA replication protein [Clostridium carboxidivorans P7]EET85262.1 AAA ATPase [Clostridium carboxidivorans P7]EFG90152.1 hypothetical protein CLCAR_0358 [Clostridium carboxidivorans P7]